LNHRPRIDDDDPCLHAERDVGSIPAEASKRKWMLRVQGSPYFLEKKILVCGDDFVPSAYYYLKKKQP
jgi:hypothetical protein